METDSSKFLSRLDIINILNSRHLHIPNIENLTYEELLRIFRTFAVPLERRHERERSIPLKFFGCMPEETIDCANMPSAPVQSLSEAQRIIERHQIVPLETPHILQQTKYLKLSFNTISNQALKRYSAHGEDSPGGPTPPKRLMIFP